MEKYKVILDTDIGDDVDDAFVLSFIMNCPNIEILGITTVYKNPVPRAKLAKFMLEKHGLKNIDVYVGEENPLVDKCTLLPFDVIGSDGKPTVNQYVEETMGNMIVKDGAVDFILDTLKKYPNEVTIIAIGPLTNIAKAIQKDIDSFKLVKDVRMMGGAIFSSFKEWNFRCDAEAAKVYFDSRIPTWLYPLDLTMECRVKPSDVEYYNTFKNGDTKVLKECMNTWMDLNKGNCPVFHDPLVAISMEIDCCRYMDVDMYVGNTDGHKGETFMRTSSSDPFVKVAYYVNPRKAIDYYNKVVVDCEVKND